MAKRWNRTETWLALGAVGIGVLLAAIAGLHTFMTATATILHPDPAAIPSVTHAEPPQQWLDAVEGARTSVRAALADQNLPALSVAVGAGGQVAWAEGFGWADLETRAPARPETRFRIGTASTVLTSAAVGLLLEQGRLQLDADIRTYVPEYPEQSWPVTLRQVMGHSAGLRSDGGDESVLFAEHCTRPEDALPHFAGSDLLFEPGTAYRYSAYGWILVSAAIEAVGNEFFHTFMRTHVFEPAGMGDTGPASSSGRIPNVATFYFPRYAADPRYGLHLMRDIDTSCYAGAGDFLTTPSDLVRFGMALETGRLLQPGTRELLQASQRLPSGDETGYGLGWDLETVVLAGAQTRVAGDDGRSLGGTVASLMTFHDRGLVVAVTSNISYADTPALALTIAEAFATNQDEQETTGASAGRRSESR